MTLYEVIHRHGFPFDEEEAILMADNIELALAAVNHLASQIKNNPDNHPGDVIGIRKREINVMYSAEELETIYRVPQFSKQFILDEENSKL